MLPAQKSQKGGNTNAAVPAKQVPALKKQPPRAQVKVVQKPRKRMLGNGGIPRAPVSKGLKFKGPKPKGEEQIQKRLQKKSPWYTSMLNPIHGADAKIPDETGVETGTTQIVYKVAVTANAQGMAGYRVKSPYVNNVPNPAFPTQEGHNFDHLAPTSSAATIDWVWGGEFDGAPDLKAISGGHRIVSAALMVQPEVSLADNKGEYTLFSAPFTLETSPQYLDYMNKYKSSTIPLNTNKPGIVRWYPIEREDISFASFIQTDGTTFSETLSTADDVPMWELGFLGTGLVVGATFRVTVVVNYEFLPRYNSLNVLSGTPSPQDATETDLVLNWTQDMDVAGTTNTSIVSSSPKTVSPQHGENDNGTGFGMFFNVLQEILPFVGLLL